MKRTIIFSAFMTILALAGIASAQSNATGGTFTITFNGQTTAPQSLSLKLTTVDSDTDVVEARFESVMDPRHKLFEGVAHGVPANDCKANRDFSMLRPVNSDRASLSYDFSTGIYTAKWIVPKGSEPCRVLVVGESTSSAGYSVWRANFGRTAFSSETSDMNATQANPISWGLDRIDQR